VAEGLPTRVHANVSSKITESLLAFEGRFGADQFWSTVDGSVNAINCPRG